jgi:hypothetical protein
MRKSMPTLKLTYESRETPTAPTPSEMLKVKVSDYYQFKPMAPNIPKMQTRQPLTSQIKKVKNSPLLLPQAK